MEYLLEDFDPLRLVLQPKNKKINKSERYKSFNEMLHYNLRTTKYAKS